MSFFKRLIKGVGKAVGTVAKVVGSSALSAVPIVGGVASKAFDALTSKKETPPPSQVIAESPPTVGSIIDNSGYPVKSDVFPNGADPTMLEPVTIKAPKTAAASSNPFNINLNLDTKNGKYSADVNNQQSPVNGNLLLYGMLGLGAIMLLKNN